MHSPQQESSPEASARRRKMSAEAGQMRAEASRMMVSSEKMREKISLMKQGMKDDAERSEQKNKERQNHLQDIVEEDEGEKQKSKEKKNGQRKRIIKREPGQDDATTFSKVVRRQYNDRVKKFSQKDHKCSNCWLIKECCVCDKIAPVTTKHEYIVYMHHFEYLRGSNTGKILRMADPHAKLYVCGQEDEEELFDHLNSLPPNRLMCLMPKDSVSLEAFVANAFKDPKEGKMLKKEEDTKHDGLDFLDSVDIFDKTDAPDTHSTSSSKHPSSSSTSSTSSSTPLPPLSEMPVVTVVVLDGTWKQVKALLNRLPEMTKVHLPMEPIQSLLTPIRQQSTPDRICTLQAAIIAMEHIGEKPEVCESLTRSLKHFMNGLLRQSGRMVKYDENDDSHGLLEVTKKVKQVSVSSEHNE